MKTYFLLEMQICEITRRKIKKLLYKTTDSYKILCWWLKRDITLYSMSSFIHTGAGLRLLLQYG